MLESGFFVIKIVFKEQVDRVVSLRIINRVKLELEVSIIINARFNLVWKVFHYANLCSSVSLHSLICKIRCYRFVCVLKNNHNTICLISYAILSCQVDFIISIVNKSRYSAKPDTNTVGPKGLAQQKRQNKNGRLEDS